ncbi:Aminopeptidase N [compost metagenome]
MSRSRAQALHKLMIVIGLLFILLVSLESPAQVLHHNLQVELIPGLKMIKGEDTLTFPPGSPRKLSFLLHKNLTVVVTSVDDSLVLLHGATADSVYAEYGLSLGSQDNKVSLTYQGVIYDPVVEDQSSGLIGPEGTALFGSTYWYPFFLDTLKSFDVTIKTPLEWTSLVQGQLSAIETRDSHNVARFVEIYPQEEIYLMAGPFKTTAVDVKGKTIQVLLRGADAGLTQNFLSLIPDYIQHYSDYLSPYPYTTFSVVENFWETGYGMPGFTLLGPTVIRLPFIMNSSLPHEILHNWWGNSVYVDYDKGNWSEGLTTYMADYWQQELAGQDRDYRLNTLIGFSDYVSQGSGNDFPVRQFKGRHNSSSQAVGYGKAMMFFHMLEFRLGKDVFKKSFQDFYTKNVFKKASFNDIQTSFEKVSGQDLSRLFTQWLDHKGAPTIELSEVKSLRWFESFSTSYALSQKGDIVYDLTLPITWTLESGEVIRQVARLTDKSQVYNLISRSRPVRLEVDANYNVFRTLYTEERPATLSGVFGAKNIHFYFDGGNTESQQFVAQWKKTLQGQSTLNSIGDSFIPATDGALVFVGDHAAFKTFMVDQLQTQDFALSDDSLRIGTETFTLADSSFALVVRRKENPTQSIVWVRWASGNNPSEWAGRLTHYGKFGILVFKGRPVVHRGTWPVLESPLKRNL